MATKAPAKKAPAKKVSNEPVRKPVSQTNKEAIEKLANAISDTPKEPVTDITHDTVKEPDVNTPEPDKAPVEDIKDSVEPVVNTEPVKPVEVAKLSIWDDIKKATEEDKHIKPIVTDTLSVESIDEAERLANLANQANGSQVVDDENARKQGNLVKAGVVVELIDVSFMLICICITWDFTNENQKKYTLEKDRKKAIQTNLYKLYELSGKKPNPKKDIWFLILGSYAPLLFVAVLTLVKNLKDKSESKKRNLAIKKMEIQEADFLVNNQMELDRAKENNLILMREIEKLKQGEMHIQKPAPFRGIPPIGKTQKQADKILLKERTRGVMAGVKRGPYKKSKA